MKYLKDFEEQKPRKDVWLILEVRIAENVGLFYAKYLGSQNFITNHQRYVHIRKNIKARWIYEKDFYDILDGDEK